MDKGSHSIALQQPRQGRCFKASQAAHGKQGWRRKPQANGWMSSAGSGPDCDHSRDVVLWYLTPVSNQLALAWTLRKVLGDPVCGGDSCQSFDVGGYFGLASLSLL
jgi:hypothetical protein